MKPLLIALVGVVLVGCGPKNIDWSKPLPDNATLGDNTKRVIIEWAIYRAIVIGDLGMRGDPETAEQRAEKMISKYGPRVEKSLDALSREKVGR
jgi:hypothetical protein